MKQNKTICLLRLLVAAVALVDEEPLSTPSLRCFCL